MKKIFYGIVAFVVVLLIALCTILFTSFGNNIVANITKKDQRKCGIRCKYHAF